MADTLLEKLTRSDVIPKEYTTINNIIKRYICSNDGYQALYEILKPHHGLLQKRIKSLFHNLLIITMISMNTQHSSTAS